MNSWSSYSDQALVDAYRQNQEEAIFNEIYLRYGHLVYGLCLKQFKSEDQAKEAQMEIFEKVLLTIPKGPIQNFKAWLYTLSRNHCISQFRKEKKQKIFLYSESELEHFSSFFMESDRLSRLYTKEALWDQVNNELDNLNDLQKEAIRLFFYEKKSYQAISVQMDCSLKKVKSLLQNGKRNLKSAMIQYLKTQEE